MVKRHLMLRLIDLKRKMEHWSLEAMFIKYLINLIEIYTVLRYIKNLTNRYKETIPKHNAQNIMRTHFDSIHVCYIEMSLLLCRHSSSFHI